MKKILAVMLSVILIASVFIPAPFVLADSPSDLIDCIEINNVSVVENTNGWLSGGWKNGEYINFWCYNNLYPGYTVYFKDGTSYNVPSGSGGAYIDGIWYSLQYDNYSIQLNNNWKVDNTYTVPCTFMGLESSFNVTITENPVERIEVFDISIIEGTSGNNTKDWDGSGYSDEYWCYNNIYPGFKIYFKDETVKTVEKGNSGTYIDGTWYSLSSSSDQSYNNQWTAENIYQVDCSFMGAESSFNVTITESPVDYIEVENTTVFANENGYRNTDNEGKEYWHYNYYFYPQYTVHFKDGTVMTSQYGNSIPVDGNHYSLSFSSDPQYESHWVLGGTYKVPCSFLGKGSSFDVKVIERPAFDYFEQDDGVIITNYNKPQTDLEIPDEIDGKPVIGINYLKYDLKSVTIPASVKYLSANAFSGRELENIFVSNDNQYYADIDGVLTNKQKTKIIAYPLAKGNTYTVPVGVIDTSVFDDWRYEDIEVIFDESQFTNIDGVLYTNDLKTIVKCKNNVSGSYIMPETVTEIMPNAFANCDKITDVKVSSMVTEIAYGAFLGCTAMTSIDLPEGLITIDESAFQRSGLKSIDMPNSVTAVCYFAFSGCENLESVQMSENISEIQGGTFSGCRSLESINIPNKANSIGIFAFSNCTSLNSIVIPNGLNRIDYSAFYNSGLIGIDIPDSVTKIGMDVFLGCGNLKNVSIGKGLSEINDSVFYGCTALESIVIPENIEYINWQAFAYCNSLKTVEFKNDDVEIAEYAFIGCDLSNTRLPKNLKVLDEGVLMATNISSIEIPGTVTDIVYRAFGYCENLTSIDIPSSVTSIGDFLLCGCNGLESVTVSDGNQNYHDETNCLIETESKILVAGCKNSIIPSDGSVTSIGAGAFGDLTSLTSITIPDTVTSIEYGAFAGCSALESISIPSSVISITDGEWYGSFSHCSGLESISVDSGNTVYHSDGNCLIETAGKTLIRGCKNSVIPADGSVTSISSGAFSGCAELTYIVIPDSVTEIGYYAFEGCYDITDVYYTGTEQQKNNMIYWGNDVLEEATWHYNCNPDNPFCNHEENEIKNAKDATCTENGCTGDTVCTDCGQILEKGDVIQAFGHSGKWKTTRMATLTEAGLKQNICKICGAVFDEEVIPALGVTYSLDTAKENEEENISVASSAESNLPETVELRAEKTEVFENSITYEIHLEDNGEQVQPEAPVLVKIPVPVGFDTEKLNIYRKEANGSRTRMNYIIDGGFAYFETEHFSTYEIIEKLCGDINGDGSLNNKDVTTLFKYLSDWKVDVNKLALDINGDGKVNNKDLTRLFQYLSDWDVEIF